MIVSSEILIQIPDIVKHITGEPLRGIVKFHLAKDTVYTNVSLALVEKACSRYIYDHKYMADYCTVPIKANDLSNYQTRKVVKIILVNENTDDDDIVLKAGSYEYSFEIIIPENTPPSAKTIHKKKTLAGIRYFLVLKFKKPGFFSVADYFITKVTIYPRVDTSSTDKPVIASLEKTLTKLFSSKKHEIELKAELDKEYLTPSCERKISFMVTNNSDVIFTIQTELICKTKTSLKYKNSVEKTEVLATVETPSIPDNSVSNMFNIIPVGQDLYTVRHSKTISREYMIRVTLKLPMPHSNVFVEIPVFAGERII